MMIDNLAPQQVSRVFILPLATFDYLKRYQRALNARTNQQHDNSQTLTKLITEHLAHVGITGKPTTAPKVALLSSNKGEQQ